MNEPYLTLEQKEAEYEYCFKMFRRADAIQGAAEHGKKYFFDLLKAKDDLLKELEEENKKAKELLKTVVDGNPFSTLQKFHNEIQEFLNKE